MAAQDPFVHAVFRDGVECRCCGGSKIRGIVPEGTDKSRGPRWPARSTSASRARAALEGGFERFLTHVGKFVGPARRTAGRDLTVPVGWSANGRGRSRGGAPPQTTVS